MPTETPAHPLQDADPRPVSDAAQAERLPGADLSDLTDSELFALEDRALVGARAGRDGAEQVWREARAEQYERAVAAAEASR